MTGRSTINVGTFKEAVIQLYLLSGFYTLMKGKEFKQVHRYRRFRVETYAGSDGRLKWPDVIDYLNWCHFQRKLF